MPQLSLSANISSESSQCPLGGATVLSVVIVPEETLSVLLLQDTTAMHNNMADSCVFMTTSYNIQKPYLFSVLFNTFIQRFDKCFTNACIIFRPGKCRVDLCDQNQH